MIMTTATVTKQQQQQQQFGHLVEVVAGIDRVVHVAEESVGGPDALAGDASRQRCRSNRNRCRSALERFHGMKLID